MLQIICMHNCYVISAILQGSYNTSVADPDSVGSGSLVHKQTPVNLFFFSLYNIVTVLAWWFIYKLSHVWFEKEQKELRPNLLQEQKIRQHDNNIRSVTQYGFKILHSLIICWGNKFWSCKLWTPFQFLCLKCWECFLVLFLKTFEGMQWQKIW